MTRNQDGCTEKSIVQLVESLDAGIEFQDSFIYAKSIEKGRLKEERTLSLYLRERTDENLLMQAKIFMGRAELFKPWIDLSRIQNRLILNHRTVVYLDSELETMVYRLLIESISTGGKIFVEYENDPETRAGLHSGVPVAATRIGYLLFQNGITGFSDFSFAGEIKKEDRTLQGVKAVSSCARTRHLNIIEEQLRHFIETAGANHDPLIGRALKRAGEILNTISLR